MKDVQFWRPVDILRTLCTDDGRQELLAAFLEDGPPGDVERVETQLARVINFRPAAVRALPDERKLSYLLQRVSAPQLSAPLRDALAWYHVENRDELLCAFLGECGIPHEGGVTDPGQDPPSPGEVQDALGALRDRFEARDIAVYFATAGLVMGAAWQQVLWPAIPLLLEGDPLEPAEAPGSTGEHAGLREAAESFTTLDDLVIKTTVAALTGVEGALSVDQVADLVEELILLNPDRHRSYFHRGYFETLAGRECGRCPVEANATRRAWLLAGQVVAWVRRGDRKAIVETYGSRRNDFAELMATPAAQAAAVMVAPHLFDALWAVGAHAEAVEAVSDEVGGVVGPTFVQRLLAATREALVAHWTPQATLLLDKLRGVLGKLSPDFGPPTSLLLEVERRGAQAERASGRFTNAESLLRQALDRFGSAAASELHADIALCLGSFKWLADVEVPEDEVSVEEMLERLRLASAPAAVALEAGDGRRTNARYILGVTELLKGQYDRARKLIEEAYGGMARRRELYPFVFDNCRLYYALAILLSAHAPQFRVAREILEQLGDDPSFAAWPEWLLRLALQIAHADIAEGVPLAEWGVRRFPRLFDGFVHDPDLVQHSAALLSELRLNSEAPDRSVELRRKDYETLLVCAKDSGDMASAAAALDGLEGLAIKSPAVRHTFEQALREEAYFEPAWTWEEAQFARVQLLEADGSLAEAGATLEKLIHLRLARAEADEALGLFARLRSYGAACEPSPEVVSRVEALEGSEELPPASEDIEETPVRLLFVGGNEEQARHDEWIRNALRSQGVAVTFVHTGWNGNWGKLAQHIRNAIPEQDGIVVMRYIRTLLGRTVRDDAGKAGKPWFACTGHGREFILRTILQAAARLRTQTMTTSEEKLVRT